MGAPSESVDQLRAKYEKLIEQGRRGGKGQSRIDRNLYLLRRLVLVEGIPPDERDAVAAGGASLDVGPGSAMTDCSLRAQVWKILLRVPAVDVAQYAALVGKGAFKGRDSEEYKQIRKDVGRTGFRKNPAFTKRVPDAKLSRVLNALLHSCESEGIGYVQGLNIVASVFLYVMPEIDAFFTLRQFITHHCPLYYKKTQKGEKKEPPKEGEDNHSRSWAVDAALYLLDQCLQVVDPGLHHHLKHFTTHLYLYTQYIYSFNAIVPLESGTSLDEVVKLWDFMFAFGAHLNILFTVARVIKAREEILHKKDKNINVPQLIGNFDADIIIDLTVHFVRLIPLELYQKLVLHTTEELDFSS